MKIDLTPLKEARQENTHKRELTVANLRSQIYDSICEYITDLSNNVPANAEKLELIPTGISIDNGVLRLIIYCKFFGKKIIPLKHDLSRELSLCTFQDKVNLIRYTSKGEIFDCTNIEFIDGTVELSNNLSLYYKDKLGVIPLTELWEEDIQSSYSIELV